MGVISLKAATVQEIAGIADNTITFNINNPLFERYTAEKVDNINAIKPKVLYFAMGAGFSIIPNLFDIALASTSGVTVDLESSTTLPPAYLQYCWIDWLTFPLSNPVFNSIAVESKDAYNNNIIEYYLTGESLVQDDWELAGFTRAAISLRTFTVDNVNTFKEWLSFNVFDHSNYRFTLVDLSTLRYDITLFGVTVTEYYYNTDTAAWEQIQAGPDNIILGAAGYNGTDTQYDTYYNTFDEIVEHIRELPLHEFAISVFASTSSATLSKVAADYREIPQVQNHVYLYGYIVDYSGNPIQNVRGYILPSHLENSEATNGAVYSVGNRTIMFETNEDGYFEVPLLPYTNGLVTIPALNVQITFEMDAESHNIIEFIDRTSYNYSLFKPL